MIAILKISKVRIGLLRVDRPGLSVKGVVDRGHKGLFLGLGRARYEGAVGIEGNGDNVDQGIVYILERLRPRLIDYLVSLLLYT